MKAKPLHLWKKAPFIRYLVPFSAGIMLQWHCCFPLYMLIAGIVFCCAVLIIFNVPGLVNRYRFYPAFGLPIFAAFFLMGSTLVYFYDIRNKSDWIGHHASDELLLLVHIEQPLSAKAKTYKALAEVRKIILHGDAISGSGCLLLYLKKDSSLIALVQSRSITQGSSLLVRVSLKEIANFKNSTGFDYRRFCSFQNIYHQAFLNPSQYILLKGNDLNLIDQLLLSTKERTLHVLRSYISTPKEAGLAEALLIGFKDDLDKLLVQSYSNTGVVHIIAISGLHVGLIYSILLLFMKPFSGSRIHKWMGPALLICCLWMFSLIAGSSPSVVRSVLMFTGIIIGKSINRSNNMYNSMAASAFLLLCYNPLWLYDAGFQLSYLAVLSLVMFMKRINNLIYVNNKLLDMLWSLASATLAAQILTIPVCLYYFHQFPNLFLITNMIAIPLSSLILIVEIFLCIIAFNSPLATLTGHLLEWLIRCMNNLVWYVERMPFALTKNIGINIYQVILLYAIIFLISEWALTRSEARLENY